VAIQAAREGMSGEQVTKSTEQNSGKLRKISGRAQDCNTDHGNDQQDASTKQSMNT